MIKLHSMIILFTTLPHADIGEDKSDTILHNLFMTRSHYACKRGWIRHAHKPLNHSSACLSMIIYLKPTDRKLLLRNVAS